MTVLSVPTADARDHLGELPDDVRVVVWDAHGDPPPGVEDIEFFVGRYGAPPPSARTLAGLPRLRVVQLLSAGVEPWPAVVPNGVELCNGRGVHGASTAELAVAGMLAMVRELPRFEAARVEHRWEHAETGSLTESKVLVVGAGDIGARIAGAARIFDAETTVVGRRPRDGVHGMDELAGLISQHDVVALAVPHTDETHHLVDADFLAAMPDGALLVNVSRGAVVDTDALVAELSTRRLRAFLDVTDPEPPPPGHPLWDVPNLMLTPHIGGGTRGWERRAYRLVREQFLRHRAGAQLRNRVVHGY